MTEKLVIISFFQTIVLLFILQELLANPLPIQKNNNTSYNIKLTDYPQLNDAKKLKKSLINFTNDLTNILEHINNLTNVVEDLIKELDYWAFEEISNITNSNISVETLQSLEDSLKILEMNITELSLELSKKHNINEVARKSASVQIYLNNLEKKLINNFRHLHQLISEYFDETNVIDKYDNLTIQKRNIDMKIEEELQTKLVEDCIYEVRNDNFLNAAFFIDIIKNSSKFEYIVESLTIEESFKLGNKITNIPKSFMLYKAIYHGLVKRKEVDEFDIIKLIRNIKEGIIDQPKTSTLIKEEAIKFNRRISRPLAHLIMEGLRIDCFQVGLKFIEEIIIADYRLAYEILFKGVYSNGYDLDCLFNRVYVETDFNQFNALKFALFLKYFIDGCRKYYGIRCGTFTMLIDELPESVRNVVFANNVCISQVQDTKFLRLEDVSYDTVRYRAIIHRSYYVPQAIWKLTHLENNVFIVENIGIADTYLDTDLYNDDKSGDHAVYGWHKPPNNAMWEFELNKDLDFFYITNLARNEFLYISDEITNIAYTKDTITYEERDYLEWKISNCTDVKLNIE